MGYIQCIVTKKVLIELSYKNVKLILLRGYHQYINILKSKCIEEKCIKYNKKHRVHFE